MDHVLTPLLITRAAGDAERLAARLGGIAAPCIAWEDAPSPPPDVADADLLVTSPRAAEPLARVGVPAGWRVLALAPATAAALVSRGIPVDHAQAGGGADLARVARAGPLVCATSDLGGDEIARVRPDVLRWVLYRTTCPPDLPPAARAALDGPFDVLFASPSAVRNFRALAPAARPRRALCHGATTLEAAALAGYSPEPYDLRER